MKRYVVFGFVMIEAEDNRAAVGQVGTVLKAYGDEQAPVIENAEVLEAELQVVEVLDDGLLRESVPEPVH